MITTGSKPAASSAVGQAKISVERAVPARSPASQVAQPTQPTARPPPKTVAKLKTEKPVKVKNPKLIRRKFKIPRNEYAVLEDLKERASKVGFPAKKSELLRAGVKALAALPDGPFLSVLNAVLAIKTGRTKNKKAK